VLFWTLLNVIVPAELQELRTEGLASCHIELSISPMSPISPISPSTSTEFEPMPNTRRASPQLYHPLPFGVDMRRSSGWKRRVTRKSISLAGLRTGGERAVSVSFIKDYAFGFRRHQGVASLPPMSRGIDFTTDAAP